MHIPNPEQNTHHIYHANESSTVEIVCFYLRLQFSCLLILYIAELADIAAS